MRVAIIGSRNCHKKAKILALQNLPSDTDMIVSGGARGADTIAREIAAENKLLLKEFLPNYKKYGKIAPIIRNEEIIQNSDLVIALWDMNSSGTASAIAYALEYGIRVTILDINNT